MARKTTGRRKVMTEAEKEASKKLLEALLDGAGEKPDGLTDRAGDVIGWWPPEGAGGVFCTPLYCKLFDSSQDPLKPAVMVFARLERARKLLSSDGKEPLDGQAGDLIAFWARPGMRALNNLCGASVWIAQKVDDEGQPMTRDTGKGNPMKLFEVESTDGGTKLPVAEDLRVKSKGVKSWVE